MLILVALEVEALHGYALVDALREWSDGVVDLAPGTIYPALHRLELARLVKSRWSGEGQRPRRVYTLTAAGRTRLAKEIDAWQQSYAAVSAVLDRRSAFA
jgi:PadR family transcriptional regulator, regulatory protein PadR